MTWELEVHLLSFENFSKKMTYQSFPQRHDWSIEAYFHMYSQSVQSQPAMKSHLSGGLQSQIHSQPMSFYVLIRAQKSNFNSWFSFIFALGEIRDLIYSPEKN